MPGLISGDHYNLNKFLDAGYCDYCYQYLELFVVPTATSNEPVVTVAGLITIGRGDDFGESASALIYASRGWDNYVRYSITQLSGNSPFSIAQVTDNGVNYVAVVHDTHIGAGAEFWSLSLDVQDADDTKVGLLTKWSSTPLHSALPHPVTPNIIIGNGGNNVGIGTTNPQHLLQVAGTIGAKEIIVSSTGADYVFDPGYKLASLNELAEYVAANHHLPEVPSATEMKTSGVSLSEMQTKLLAKIEELTLHLIEADRRIRQLERR